MLGTKPPQKTDFRKEAKKISKKKSIIIEGSFLNKILNKNKNHFFELVRNFKTCIFCRVTPIQKSMIVQFVKKTLPEKVT